MHLPVAREFILGVQETKGWEAIRFGGALVSALSGTLAPEITLLPCVERQSLPFKGPSFPPIALLFPCFIDEETKVQRFNLPQIRLRSKTYSKVRVKEMTCVKQGH